MRVKTVLVSAVSASLLLIAATGQAGRRVTVEKQSFKGVQASVTFTISQDIPCGPNPEDGTGSVFAGGFLQGSQQITKQTGAPKVVNNGVFVEIFSYSNSCTGASLPFGIGSIANGFTPPNRRLNSAGLDGTAPVQDLDSGAIHNVDVDVVFQGTGPITASNSTTKTKTVHPFVITINTSGNANRAAVASGTVTIDGVVLNPTFDPATLNDNVNSTITIEK